MISRIIQGNKHSFNTNLKTNLIGILYIDISNNIKKK